MISVRTGDLTPLRLFIYNSWVPVNLATDYGATPNILVYAYLDQVVTLANRQALKVLTPPSSALPNEINYLAKLAGPGAGGPALPMGRYGIVVFVSSLSGAQLSYFPGAGSGLLIVGDLI